MAKATKDEWGFNLCGLSILLKCDRNMLKNGKQCAQSGTKHDGWAQILPK